MAELAFKESVGYDVIKGTDNKACVTATHFEYMAYFRERGFKDQFGHELIKCKAFLNILNKATEDKGG